MTTIREAAQGVVDRWDTPLWKDVPATAHYIAALREALTQEKEWVGLTDDDAIELLPIGYWEIDSTLDFAKAIEQALKEKNT
jgi:transcriptional regulator of nitric oxide reductase